MDGKRMFTVFERNETESHKEYAYRVLRDNIMTMNLVPDTVLNEGDLAELLQISRTPVHEAITKLSDEYLIDIYPRKASIVSRIDLSNFREGYFMRLMLEPAIIRQIEGMVPGEGAAKLLEILEKQKRVIENTKDPDEFLKLDNAFHECIYQIASKPLSWNAVKSVNGHFERVRYMDAIMNKTDLESLYQDHKWLYHTLLTGMLSEAKIREFYEKHLGKLWENFYSLLENYPEYFRQ